MEIVQKINLKILIVMKNVSAIIALRANVNFVMKTNLIVFLVQAIITNMRKAALKINNQIVIVIIRKFVRNVKTLHAKIVQKIYKHALNVLKDISSQKDSVINPNQAKRFAILKMNAKNVAKI
ncbi:transmembrane protein, putative (macronuclear) [Tetrahymena thermophila SB210]|uniref:Transmembrane protein, putative n=1 Tax=Tetrahymena thermophila (strain SB210) TaxID=312017 RepID=W7XLN1_TETTS|nr:transmembrane protein, putative [Tetrahymena thermophila SB210]EWS76579.1 transmembrane protein, putative [Tetrahymena thermophila SB210]|eukprot:XP_012650865.1 transmembrane protein, putative [Tetrahymena thermophila SB210]